MYDRIIRGRSMYNGQAIRQSMHARVSVFTTVVVVVSYANVNVFGTAVCTLLDNFRETKISKENFTVSLFADILLATSYFPTHLEIFSLINLTNEKRQNN